MKILWISHLVPYPPKGGVLQRVFYLLRELSHYHEVDLLAFNQSELLCSFYPSLEKGLSEASEVLKDVVNQHAFFEIPNEIGKFCKYKLAFKSLFFEPYNINWLKSDFFSVEFTRYLNSNAYDLVHFDTISLVPYFHVIRNNTLTSLGHHNIESHMLLRRASKEKNLFKKFYFWQEGIRLAGYEQFYCPKFSVNITCSDLDSTRLNNITRVSNAVSIPNGVDTNYLNPVQIKQKNNQLIFVGSMNWYPNVQAVIYFAENVWLPLKKIHKDLHFHVVGINPPKCVQDLANSLPDFHVHGFVDDVRQIIEESTVYVCPILDGGGTKLKILDAMAMEKAIVAHPIACEGINVKNGHNILLAETPSQFVDQIDYLLRYHDKRIDIGRNARDLMKSDYDYSIIGKKLSDTFMKLVN